MTDKEITDKEIEAMDDEQYKLLKSIIADAVSSEIHAALSEFAKELRCTEHGEDIARIKESRTNMRWLLGLLIPPYIGMAILILKDFIKK